jgi:hypothetical protein
VARPGDIDDVQVVLLDDAVQVDVDEVQPRRRAPVPEQARLDVLQRERFLQQRIVVEIDLPDRQIVRGPPIGVHLAEHAPDLGPDEPVRRFRFLSRLEN